MIFSYNRCREVCAGLWSGLPIHLSWKNWPLAAQHPPLKRRGTFHEATSWYIEIWGLRCMISFAVLHNIPHKDFLQHSLKWNEKLLIVSGGRKAHAEMYAIDAHVCSIPHAFLLTQKASKEPYMIRMCKHIKRQSLIRGPYAAPYKHGFISRWGTGHYAVTQSQPHAEIWRVVVEVAVWESLLCLGMI